MTRHKEVVDRLWRAARDGSLVRAATHDLPDLSRDDAYAIQRAVLDRLEQAGDERAGWKVGMTAAGTPGPIYGELLAGMLLSSGDRVDASRLHEPDVEGEIAFVLNRRLRGPGVTAQDVLAATRGVRPAIEIIAGRLEPGEHRVADFIADNAASALAVLGETLVPVADLDLRLIGMVHTRGDEVVGTGAGARVLGDPAAAVAWLANALADAGRALEAGTVVLSGSVAPAVRARPGDAFTVEFDRLGQVSVTFA